MSKYIVTLKITSKEDIPKEDIQLVVENCLRDGLEEAINHEEIDPDFDVRVVGVTQVCKFRK